MRALTGRVFSGFADQGINNSDPKVGDGRQELGFIGFETDESSVHDSVESCLLTKAEISTGSFAGPLFSVPFPGWDVRQVPTGMERAFS